MVRLASFNVENLFERAKVLDAAADTALGATGTIAAVVLQAFADFNRLIAKREYSPADKLAILELSATLGLLDDDESAYVILRRNRGRLLDRRADGGQPRVQANGRADWLGWLELKTEAVNEVSTQNTARVIREVDADILVVVEAEHRTSLNRFNKQVLGPLTGAAYDHVMLIDGNDERGIDVGVMARRGCAIESMRSHVDDREAGETVFSRDCPEYLFTLPSGARLLVMANHLKSKSARNPKDAAAAAALRTLQAQHIRRLYDQRLAAGFDYIAVVGDLNDSPDSAPLQCLLAMGSTLTDIGSMKQYVSDGFIGTFGNCGPDNKIDYILCSPALANRVTGAGVNRSGLWGDKHVALWPRMPQLTKESEAASDHAAIFVDLDL
jgi:endonuclease/exonuclease/phosphatase family metal-dependent hydrolase